MGLGQCMLLGLAWQPVADGIAAPRGTDALALRGSRSRATSASRDAVGNCAVFHKCSNRYWTGGDRHNRTRAFALRLYGHGRLGALGAGRSAP